MKKEFLFVSLKLLIAAGGYSQNPPQIITIVDIRPLSIIGWIVPE